MKKNIAILIPLIVLHCSTWCQIEDRLGCYDISRMPGWERYYVQQRDTMFCITYYSRDDEDSIVYQPLEKIGRKRWILRNRDTSLYFELKLVRTCHKNKRSIPGKSYKLRSLTRYENGKRKFKSSYWWRVMYRKSFNN